MSFLAARAGLIVSKNHGPLPRLTKHKAVIFVWLFLPWALLKVKTGDDNLALRSLSGENWELVGLTHSCGGQIRLCGRGPGPRHEGANSGCLHDHHGQSSLLLRSKPGGLSESPGDTLFLKYPLVRLWVP